LVVLLFADKTKGLKHPFHDLLLPVGVLQSDSFVA